MARTAVELAREFASLRTLQRLLRIYEVTHGNVHDIERLRLHVITEMKKLAKLIGYGLPLFLLFTVATLAQHNHARHHASYQSWVNKQGTNCCNNHDCGELKDEDERTVANGVVEVRIDGRWCPVMPHHYLRQGNAPDWSVSHVCIAVKMPYLLPAETCSRLLCYQPKPGI